MGSPLPGLGLRSIRGLVMTSSCERELIDKCSGKYLPSRCKAISSQGKIPPFHCLLLFCLRYSSLLTISQQS